MNPRPESRIESLEKRASTIEAQIIEMSNDTAESLKDLKQDMTEVKQTLDKVSKAFVQNAKDIAEIKTTLTTLATKDDISELKSLVIQLLHQKPDK